MSEKKSNFSVTCSLLSQYIKKKGSFGDLGILDMASKTQEPSKGSFRQPTTLNLLPGVDVSADNQTGDMVSASEQINYVKGPENAQLTIFYGGKVFTFDNFPAEKAADLMKLASKDSCVAASSTSSENPSLDKPNTTGTDVQIRRASLQRFLEKRKHRITASSPYQVDGSANIKSTTKPDVGSSWLGLGQGV